MSRTLRVLFAALVASALLFGQVAPALAASTSSVNDTVEQERSVPVVFDALVLRPLGMLTTVFGTAAFCVTAPIVAITRPTDLAKPFRLLVIRPAKYTWVDPLGQH